MSRSDNTPANPEDELLFLAARQATLAALEPALAHDLSSPLNGIVLNLELLRRSAANHPDSEVGGKQRRWIDVIDKELGRLRRALGILLSQVAPGEDKMEVLELRETLQQTLELVGPRVRQQRIELEPDLGEEAVEVWGARRPLQLALLAILVDALEGTEEGGTLTIELSTESDRATIALGGAGGLGAPADRPALGLRAADAVCRELGGSLSVERSGARPGSTIALPRHERGNR